MVDKDNIISVIRDNNSFKSNLENDFCYKIYNNTKQEDKFSKIESTDKQLVQYNYNYNNLSITNARLINDFINPLYFFSIEDIYIKTNEIMKIKLTENKLRQIIREAIIKHLNKKNITEGYYPKSKRNNSVDHMENVFMQPNDEFDNETGKWSEDNFPLPEKKSYSNLMAWYMDFCSNYIDAYNTTDEHWTFIYQSGQIINQDGDNGTTNGMEKRNEKALPQEERFKPVQRKDLAAIIYSNGDGEWYWYKDFYGKELLTDYTGWSFEDLGDDWL